jgi:hypothetical protein
VRAPVFAACACLVVVVGWGAASWRVPDASPDSASRSTDGAAEVPPPRRTQRPTVGAPPEPVPSARSDDDELDDRRPDYQWPDEIDEGWRDIARVSTLVNSRMRHGPFAESAFHPWLFSTESSSLAPEHIEATYDSLAEACGFPPMAWFDCSEAPCIAFSWMPLERYMEDLYSPVTTYLTCEAMRARADSNVEHVGDFAVDCASGDRWVSWVVAGGSLDATVADGDLDLDDLDGRVMVRVLSRPPEFYCSLPEL